ncbi:hypothetical protein LCGC14_2527030, partial [marine sediment metagenome]
AIYFEASTQYTFYPHVENKNLVDDLYDYNPDLKFIYLVRSPIDRIISSYIHGYQRGFIKKDINEELINNPFFIDISKYAAQISPYIQTFDRENILIIDFDDFISDQHEIVSDICKFLGIHFNPDLISQDEHSNKSLGNVKLKKQYSRLFNPLKKLSSYLPLSIQHSIKTKIKNTGLFTSETITQKPSLSPETLSFIHKNLDSDITELESILGKSLASWK